MNKKKMLLIIKVIFIIILLSILFFSIYKIIVHEDKYTENITQLDLKGVNKIMIVAHPDDELLWGGKHLIEDKYLVVCITCGDDKEREIEFEMVMRAVNCPYLSLRYPDRNDWKYHKDNIKKDLKEILSYKDFKQIVTHNPDGEYGHDQHKKTSKYVTELANKNNLYYFNHYYTAEEIENNGINTIPMDNKSLKEKEKILELYETQKDIINNHKAMIPYEEFISYDIWYKT